MTRVSNREQVKTIVHLARRYSPMIGGVEKHLARLNCELIERGYNVSVITERTKSDLVDFEILDKVSIYRLSISSEDTSNNFISKLKFKFKLWWSLWQKREILSSADHIHIHDVFFWILPFWVFFFRKVHITFHGYEGNNVPKRTQVLWHRLAGQITRNNLCIGGFHQKWFRVIPSEVSFGAVDNQVKNSQQNFSKTNFKKFIFAGRLERDTGILAYLSAFKIIQEKNPSASLEIFGDGELKSELENYIYRHNLNVQLRGFQKNIEKLLPNFDAVFASGYLTILEAMVSGKPIFAYYQSDLKKDYLTLTPFSNWIAIADSPRQIANHVESFKFAHLAEGQKWAKQQTWSKMADVYEKIWY